MTKPTKAKFRNFYRCTCGEAWDNEDDCTCNDRCPKCNAEIEPHLSEDIPAADPLDAIEEILKPKTERARLSADIRAARELLAKIEKEATT